MAWIESHEELAQHPKAKRLARTLGVSMPTVIGHLHCLWWWAMNYAPDGDLSDFDPEDIADAAMWEGDAHEFLAALVECGPGNSSGFVDRDENGMRLHDWGDYGNEHKKRQEAAERKRRSRAKRELVTRESRSSHVTVTGRECDSHADVTPDRTDRTDKTDRSSRAHAREGDASPDAAQDPDLPPASSEERAILQVLKGISNYPFAYQTDLDHLRALAVDFPELDLLDEAKRWATYKRDKPIGKRSNPRLQFRNWCAKAREFGRGRDRASPRAAFRLTPQEQAAIERELAAARQQATVTQEGVFDGDRLHRDRGATTSAGHSAAPP